MKVLITGANGFIGYSLLRYLLDELCDIEAVPVVRKTIGFENEYVIEDLNCDFLSVFDNVDCVIHLAARAHVMQDKVSDPYLEYKNINVDGTYNILTQAEKAGVKKFIFLSSIKVNGEKTQLGKPFTAKDSNIPVDLYGRSKFDAEQKIKKFCETSRINYVIIRAPMVYGEGVKGNMRSLMKLVNSGLPVPLGGIDSNLRSMVSVKNLCGLISTCIKSEKANNETYLISDGKDLSTTEIVRKIAKGMDKKLIFVSVPNFIKMLLKFMGKKAHLERLFGNLQVDMSYTERQLNWTPAQSIDEGFKEMCENFLKNSGN